MTTNLQFTPSGKTRFEKESISIQNLTLSIVYCLCSLLFPYVTTIHKLLHQEYYQLNDSSRLSQWDIELQQQDRLIHGQEKKHIV